MQNIDTNNRENLSQDEQDIFSILREVVKAKAPSTTLRAAGGWVRDKLLGIPSDDIDIMVDNMSGADFARFVAEHLNLKDPHVIKANPEKSKHIQTAKAFIPLPSGNTQEVDFARARSEVYHGDSRIPETKPATPEEDALRRDLTINALFFNINSEELEDLTGHGLEDLQNNVMRTPEDPLKTFRDDPLRIFRAIRFASKYGGEIDIATYQAMQDPSLREEIKRKISKERIGVEIVKMLKGPHPKQALEYLEQTGLFQDILTEALVGTDFEGQMEPLQMEQNNPHHELTLWGHTLTVVGHILDKYAEADPEKRLVMTLAALTHDLGKLYRKLHQPSKSHPWRTSYIGHEKASRNIVEHILRYLKLEPYIKEVSGLARYHMQLHTLDRASSAMNALRKFIRRMGERSLDWIDVFNLSVADAYSKGVEVDPDVVSQYQAFEERLREALHSMRPLEDKTVPAILNGNDIMEALSIRPGPWMSEVTEFVKELQDDNSQFSNRD